MDRSNEAVTPRELFALTMTANHTAEQILESIRREFPTLAIDRVKRGDDYWIEGKRLDEVVVRVKFGQRTPARFRDAVGLLIGAGLLR